MYKLIHIRCKTQGDNTTNFHHYKVTITFTTGNGVPFALLKDDNNDSDDNDIGSNGWSTGSACSWCCGTGLSDRR